MTKVSVEQPLALPGSAKKYIFKKITIETLKVRDKQFYTFLSGWIGDVS